jgi:hypothetical protein
MLHRGMWKSSSLEAQDQLQAKQAYINREIPPLTSVMLHRHLPDCLFVSDERGLDWDRGK